MALSLIRPLLSTLSPGGQTGRLSILIFHRVLPEPDPLFPFETSRARFESILIWMKRWFNVLPLDAAVQRLKAGELPTRAACITFDDGYADNATVALPLLQRHGLPATFFIATGFLNGGRMFNDTVIEAVRAARAPDIDLGELGLGRMAVGSIEEKRAAISTIIPAVKHLPAAEREQAVQFVGKQCSAALPADLMMTSDQVRALHAAGMTIGGHTVTHPILTRCSPETARQEISDGRDRLEDLTGDRVTLFAYPNGKFGQDYTAEHAKLVADLGFDAAVSTNPGASRHGDDAFQLRRFTPWDQTRTRFGLRMAKNLMGKRN